MDLEEEKLFKINDMAKQKKEQTTNIKEDEMIKDEDLLKVIRPFAEWAWGSKETAQIVIDKYFKQVINK